MPRRHTLPPQQIRLTTDQLSRPPSPFKNILPDNNERKCDGTIGKELDSSRYLHKKFKKVATLEETTPVAAVAACGGDTTESLLDITTAAVSPGGRYVCPYCALPCAKPSVLQKHIRAHTNERPYPCRPCGFAFKTKSNLYKHCRSRAHTLKMDVTDCSSNPSSGEEEDSGGSGSPNIDSEQPNKNKIYKPKFHTLQGPDVEASLASPTPKNFAHRINRLICEGDSGPEAPARISCSSPLKEDSPEAASPFPSRLALALLRPPPATTLETVQPLNLSQKEQRLQGNHFSISQPAEGSLVKGILKEVRTGLNGFKKTTLPGVKCPDCGLTVDKLDVHFRVGCLAQTQMSSDSNLLGQTERSPLHIGPGNVTTTMVRLMEISKSSSSSHLNSRSVDVPQASDRLSQVAPLVGRSMDIQPLLGGRVRSEVSLPLAPRTVVTSPVLTKTLDTPPVFGRTALIEPQEKRRKLSPKPFSLSPPDLISSIDLSPHQKSIRLFGGQVKILDGPGGEVRTLRIDSGNESPTPISEPADGKDRRILTISKTGHHSVGLTVIQSDMKEERKNNETLSSKIAVPILSNIHRPTPVLDPLTTITAFNPLTLPPRTAESSMIVQPLTIVHGGKAIPHVPGMPGPNSLLDPSLVRKPAESFDPVLSKKDLSPPLPRSQEDNLKSVEQTTLTAVSTPLQSTTSSELSEKKFVRPTWLPLKSGTYVAKKPPSSLGPPPVALVSPETPRPRKSYGQLYLNGHAYTYLGLKCSSRMFFCTLNKPQPIYVPLTPEHVSLSMYSNWKVVSESALSPLGLSPACVMSSYDSRNRNSGFSQAGTTTRYQVLHSSYSSGQEPTSQSQTTVTSQIKELPILTDEDNKRLKVCNGGYESNEDYVYIRGRGRGKYVCEECGVRCSKPSMLKKHIRTTHSDLRPYACKYCSFSFKTKGNLTKHMKSKAHYKQCVDLDITPVPMTVDASNIDIESLVRQNALCKELGADVEGSSEETEEDEEEEDLVESEDEEGKMEREAAVSLLSLSEVAQQSALQDYVNLGLISSASRPLTYPYTLFQEARPKSSSEDREESQEESQEEPLELTSTSQSSDVTTPIDLSNKSSSGDTSGVKLVDPELNLLSVLSTPVGALSPGINILSPVLPSPLGTPSVISDEGCALMTAYLKEKAARDTFIKQQQYNKHNSSLSVRLSLPDTRNVLAENSPAGSIRNIHSPINVENNRLAERSAVDFRVVDATSTVVTSRMHDSCRSLENRQQMDSSSVIENLSVEAKVTENTSERLPVENVRRSALVYISESETGIVSVPATVTASDHEMMEVEESLPEDSSTSESVHSAVDNQNVLSSAGGVNNPASQGSAIVNHSAKESALGILALTSSQAASKQPASILPPHSKLKAEFIPPASGPNYINVIDEGKSVCGICQKVFTKPSQLRLHVNIHYFERPFRCDSCGVSFRTKGHLQKHQRSISHLNKVNMNSTFGTATMSNPRPFKCTDCKIAFRIHGHLAKHLRSKMHIMRLECLGKLPFGMYAELERSGLNIHDIDTTDCHNSLESLQILAQKLHEKDPSKLGQWAAPVDGGNQAAVASDMNASAGETSSDEDEPMPAQAFPVTQHCPR